MSQNGCAGNSCCDDGFNCCKGAYIFELWVILLIQSFEQVAVAAHPGKRDFH
jgi:hypothetical protein